MFNFNLVRKKNKLKSGNKTYENKVILSVII